MTHMTQKLCFTDSESDRKIETRQQADGGSDGTTAAWAGGIDMDDGLRMVQSRACGAWALPGDRATKSLYESVGWKARLLTMRGA